MHPWGRLRPTITLRDQMRLRPSFTSHHPSPSPARLLSLRQMQSRLSHGKMHSPAVFRELPFQWKPLQTHKIQSQPHKGPRRGLHWLPTVCLQKARMRRRKSNFRGLCIRMEPIGRDCVACFHAYRGHSKDGPLHAGAREREGESYPGSHPILEESSWP